MRKYVFVIGLVVLLSQYPAFSMGGPAPESSASGSTSSVSGRVEELDKARAELKKEKTELEKIEKYIWSIDVKMDQARRSQNTKRLLQLKELEQDAIERARLIEGSIARKYKEYPELKVSEAIEAEKVSKPETAVKEEPKAEIKIIDMTQEQEQPQPQVQEQPAAKPAPKPAAVKPAANANIVYHVVELGDTFYNISRKYYGTPSFYKEIARLNGMTDLSGLKQGMVLKIDMRLKNIAPQKPVQTPPL